MIAAQIRLPSDLTHHTGGSVGEERSGRGIAQPKDRAGRETALRLPVHGGGVNPRLPMAGRHSKRRLTEAPHATSSFLEFLAYLAKTAKM